jgi:hypothetical protein
MARKPKSSADPHGSTPASGSDRHVANRVESYGTPYKNLNETRIVAEPKLSGMGASKPLTNYRKGLELAKARTEYGNVYEVKDKAGNTRVSQKGYKGNSYFGATSPRKPAVVVKIKKK